MICMRRQNGNLVYYKEIHISTTNLSSYKIKREDDKLLETKAVRQSICFN